MSLPHLVASSRRLMNMTLGKRTRISPQGIVDAAVSTCEPLLHRRNQNVVLESASQTTGSRISRENLAELVCDALCDISGLTPRGEAIRVIYSGRTIRFTSSHPIEVPEQSLVIDNQFRLRAYALQVNVKLFWEQGRGPVLELSLPGAPHLKSSLQSAPLRGMPKTRAKVGRRFRPGKVSMAAAGTET